MTEHAGTSAPEHDDPSDGRSAHLDEADDASGHLMVRTDEAVSTDQQAPDAARWG